MRDDEQQAGYVVKTIGFPDKQVLELSGATVSNMQLVVETLRR